MIIMIRVEILCISKYQLWNSKAKIENPIFELNLKSFKFTYSQTKNINKWEC